MVFVLLVCICICPHKSLNGTVVVDSPFQTLMVDFSSYYRLALPLCASEMLSSIGKSRITLFNVHLAIFSEE